MGSELSSQAPLHAPLRSAVQLRAGPGALSSFVGWASNNFNSLRFRNSPEATNNT